MQYVIQSSSDLERLKDHYEKKVFCKILEGSNRYHPKLNSTLGVYLHVEGEEDGYIINIDHPDALCLNIELVKDTLSKFAQIYVLDKKHFLYHFSLRNLVDIQLINTLEYFDKLILPVPTKAHNWYYSRYGDRRDINKIIPIVKHYEYFEEVYYLVKDFLKAELDDSFYFFNNIASTVFFLIENEGLGILEESFIETFEVDVPDYNIFKNTIYTYYNLYNYTSRPTNAFNGINFAAIAHETSHRQTIVPKYDKFIEADFDGYHIRLVADLINYELDQTSAHKQLGKLYFNKQELSQEEYKETKQINFQAIYGKTPEEYKHLEFFSKLEDYIKGVWGRFSKEGEVSIPISNKKFTSKLEGMYPKKLFNYILQGLETANNIVILKDILKLLQHKKTKIVLYTYDSILFDYSEEDGLDLIEELKEVVSKKGKYPINIKESKNLVL